MNEITKMWNKRLLMLKNERKRMNHSFYAADTNARKRRAILVEMASTREEIERLEKALKS